MVTASSGSREIEDRWEYADFKADPRWCRGWISMDCALYAEDADRVYLWEITLSEPPKR